MAHRAWVRNSASFGLLWKLSGTFLCRVQRNSFQVQVYPTCKPYSFRGCRRYLSLLHSFFLVFNFPAKVSFNGCKTKYFYLTGGPFYYFPLFYLFGLLTDNKPIELSQEQLDTRGPTSLFCIASFSIFKFLSLYVTNKIIQALGAETMMFCFKTS